jgi:translation initiation factor 4E
MKLKDTWALWEQVVPEPGAKSDKYGDATRKVTEFTTVQEFWSIWNGLPQPSELFNNRFMRDQPNGQSVPIDAIMIFKKGIAPEWEDPKNANGGHIQINMKTTAGGGLIDEYWNNLALGMIGGSLEPSDIITGIRLVDKLAGPKSVNAIRIELWFTKSSETNVKSLQRSMEKCLGTRLDGTVQPLTSKPDMKPHSGKH